MFQNKEIWKDIKGYEGRYQVSNMGRVKSLERTVTRKNGLKLTIRERILKPFPDRGVTCKFPSMIPMARENLLKYIALFAKPFPKILRTSLA